MVKIRFHCFHYGFWIIIQWSWNNMDYHLQDWWKKAKGKFVHTNMTMNNEVDIYLMLNIAAETSSSMSTKRDVLSFSPGAKPHKVLLIWGRKYNNLCWVNLWMTSYSTTELQYHISQCLKLHRQPHEKPFYFYSWNEELFSS